jgi:hypothetical protein
MVDLKTGQDSFGQVMPYSVESDQSDLEAVNTSLVPANYDPHPDRFVVRQMTP